MHRRIKIKNLLSFIAIVFIFVIPIFRYYDFIGTDISLYTLLRVILAFIVLSLVLLNKKKPTNSLSKSKRYFIFFCVYSLFITFFYVLLTDISLNSINTYLMFILSVILLILILYIKLDARKVFGVYSFFVWTILIFYIFQWILILSNIRIDFKLPLHEYSASWDFLNGLTFGMIHLPTALFSERAHFSLYLVPYIAFALFSKGLILRNRFIKAIIVTIAVLASVSGNGIILVLLCWTLYFFVLNNNRTLNNKIIISSFGLLLLIFTYIILNNIPEFSRTFSVLFVNPSGTTKADYRIYRGLDTYFLLPLIQQIFGVGFYHMSIFAEIFGITSIYDYTWQTTTEYYSAISQVLLYFGAFGTFLFGKHLFHLYRGQSNLTKALVLIYIAACFSSEIFLDSFHIMFIIFFIVSVELESNEVQIKDSVKNIFK